MTYIKKTMSICFNLSVLAILLFVDIQISLSLLLVQNTTKSEFLSLYTVPPPPPNYVDKYIKNVASSVLQSSSRYCDDLIHPYCPNTST